MKRILSLFLVLILISLSMITVVAMEPLPPEDYVDIYFEKLYSTVETDYKNVVKNSTTTYINDSNPYQFYYEYVLVEYTSNNPIQEPYFNKFGNNEFYEYSDVTNLMFESGITVFYGHCYSPENRPEHHNDDFYSLEELAQLQPTYIKDVVDQLVTILGPERVGYIGDSDCDGEVTILDATAIQRHLAQLDVLKIELASDIDDNGYVDITDATNLQLKLANLE